MPDERELPALQCYRHGVNSEEAVLGILGFDLFWTGCVGCRSCLLVLCWTAAPSQLWA